MELPELPEVVLEEQGEQQESAGEEQPSPAPQQVPAAVRKLNDSFTGALHSIM